MWKTFGGPCLIIIIIIIIIMSRDVKVYYTIPSAATEGGYDLVRAVDSFIFASLISRFTLILSIGTVFFLHHIA